MSIALLTRLPWIDILYRKLGLRRGRILDPHARQVEVTVQHVHSPIHVDADQSVRHWDQALLLLRDDGRCENGLKLYLLIVEPR